MFQLPRIVLAIVVLGTLGLLAGCGTSTSPSTATPPAQPTAKETPATDKSMTAAADAEVEKSLAELSPEDQKLARQQKICPVSGEALGGMGKPYKIEVQGRTVFLCCSGCEAEIRKDPEKYFKKLDAPKP